MLWLVCVRDVNLAVTVLCVNTGNSHSKENVIAMPGSGSVTYGDFHALRDSEPAKNSSFEGSREEAIDALRLRAHFEWHFDCDNGSEFDSAGWMKS